MRVMMILPLLAAGSMGCTFIARDATRYRNDTTALLEQNSGSLKDCYDSVLKTESSAAGTVVVKFKLKDETGAIFDVKVDDKSTAPPAVRECVVNAISGLKLDPPDAREGHATYTWEFEVAPQASSKNQASGFETDS